MTYGEAVTYLESLANYEIRRDPAAMRSRQLSTMERLCRRLGDPHRRFRSIVVAGTNGKGSICAMLYAMLRQTPMPVGLYTSPHLDHLRERIRVSDGSSKPSAETDWISEEAFAATIERIHSILEELRRGPPEEIPTYFEALTAAAFVYFAERGVEVAVLEVGLGGRLDATNVVEQAVSVIGPIGVDHAEILGKDPAAIAREKAGIIKSAQAVISAPQREDVTEVLRVFCDAHGVPLVRCGDEVTVGIQRHDFDGLQLSITGLRGIYESLELPLIGRHQAQNAAVAVAALEALSTTGIPHALVRDGLARVEWPGRIEVVNESPLILLDGAHNPQAMAALCDTITELCPGRAIHLLIGMSSDKEVEAVGQVLEKLSVSVTCTKSAHPRALDPIVLAQRLAPFCFDVHVMSDPVDAYTYLLNAIPSDDVIVVTGSLFLIGQLRAALQHAHVRPRRSPQLQEVVA